MAKFLVSSIQLLRFLETSLSRYSTDQYFDFQVFKGRFEIGEGHLEVETGNKLPEVAAVSRTKVIMFTAILYQLDDQPIVIGVDDNKVWLMQCIIN